MPRPTKTDPERGNARDRLLEAARDVIRTKGFTAATVADLCEAAGVTKGAYFHHFPTKDALGVAAAEYWAEMTGALFETAPYHAPETPLGRLLAYIDFRKAIAAGELPEFTCLVGTMAQEVYDTHPDIRDACAASILGHAETLVPDIEAAMAGRTWPFTAQSLAEHFQAVIQGGFILAKATGDPSRVHQSLDHLRAYVQQLFSPERT